MTYSPYATILSGDESRAADILRNVEHGTFIVRDLDATRAIVCQHLAVPDADTAIRLANAWVTQ